MTGLHNQTRFGGTERAAQVGYATYPTPPGSHPAKPVRIQATEMDHINWELLKGHTRPGETDDGAIMRLAHDKTVPKAVQAEALKAGRYLARWSGSVNKALARESIQEFVARARQQRPTPKPTPKIKERTDALRKGIEKAQGDGAGIDPGYFVPAPAPDPAEALVDQILGAGKIIEEEAREPFEDKDAQALGTVMFWAGIEYRYNLRSYEREVLVHDHCKIINKAIPRNKWTGLKDYIEDEIKAFARKHFTVRTKSARQESVAPLNYGRDRWPEAMGCLDNRKAVEPCQDYFNLCKKIGWDGVERAATWPIEILGAADDEITRKATLALLGGAVTRTFRPGAKFDCVPVFVGPQGIGKSSAPKYLCPPYAQDEWFNDNFFLDQDHKGQIEQMLNSLFIEIGEFAGNRRAERQKMKSMISRQTDKVRLAYNRNVTKAPRRFVFFATSNDEFCVPFDPSGGRRWAVIRCTGAGFTLDQIRAWMDANREQIWAEIMVMYEAGKKFYIHGEVERQIMARSRLHMDEDTSFAAKVETLRHEAAPLLDLMREADLLHRETETANRSDQYRFRDTLEAAGWTYTGQVVRWHGKLVRLWYPPKQVDGAENGDKAEAPF